MNKTDDDKIKALIHRIGLKYNLQDEVIRKIISSPYKFTREKISELQVNDDMTEEEYNKLKTNFIYLYIGKLYTTFDICTKFYKINKERWKKKEI
jgi:hypothetical protein